ncbi:MAG: hypothetical protein LUE92_03455 [Clostridiales bacterium]|nr:hypothetical protein [Clostridiales bacterium]
MKKIINRKKYDTETAERIGTYQTRDDRRDFSCVRETLYRKRTGEYFLYGEGGPKTEYARQVGQTTWAGGCEIIPYTEDEAKKWSEKHLSVDRYEEVFGEVAE